MIPHPAEPVCEGPHDTHDINPNSGCEVLQVHCSNLNLYQGDNTAHISIAVETAAHMLQAVSWVCYVGIYYSTIKQCSLTETQATEGQMNMGHMVRLHIACLHEYSAYRQLHSKCNQLAADANDAMECAPDTKAC